MSPLHDPTLTLTIGTRASPLALWQSEHIAARIAAAWPGADCRLLKVSTAGDRQLDRPLPEIGGKGLFTAELERALLDRSIDLAVHSLKDLPVEDAPGVVVGAIVGRADVRDALVTRGAPSLSALPEGAVVGTSSLRRQAQLLALRPDLAVRSIRGNVETRIRKVLDGEYDATLLAVAGLARLGLEGRIAERLPLSMMLPAPGQGALAVQCRADDAPTRALLAAIDEGEVRAHVLAERTFLSTLGGGCATPVAAHARPGDEGEIELTGLVASVDGRRVIRLEGRGAAPRALGEALAREALARGASEILGQHGQPTAR